MTNLENATDLADERGFLKGKSHQMDGNLIVSSMNNNVQYRYNISSMVINGVSLGLTLNYNQNASYTAFKRWKDTINRWEQLKQNRPVWILGIGGFAVQALTMCSRPFLQGDLRFDNETYVGSFRTPPHYGDTDMVWALEGWDYCNRMNDIAIASTGQGDYVDVIRLLREDGSVLMLHHATKPSSEMVYDARQKDSSLISGTYVTNDANSKAYALVTIDGSLLTQDQHAALWYSKGGDTSIRAQFLPRRVEYFPGDGTSFIFREWISPYGTEYLTEAFTKGISGGGINTLDRYLESGAWVAGPTVFYLDSIRYNCRTLLTFEYDGQRRNEAWTSEQSRGRASLIGFDGHTFDWDYAGMDITANGRHTILRWDSAIYGGHISDWEKHSGRRPVPSTALADDDDEYMSWSGLVTEIIDPAQRSYKFRYDTVSKSYQKTQFPRASGNESLNEAKLTLNSMQLTSTIDDAVRKDIVWWNIDSCMSSKNFGQLDMRT